MQPPTMLVTPKNDLTIRPWPVLPAPMKRVGTPLAREVTTRNWAEQVKQDNTTPLNIHESDAEPGRPGKAPRLISQPPSVMNSQHDGALATVIGREDDIGEKDNVGSSSVSNGSGLPGCGPGLEPDRMVRFGLLPGKQGYPAGSGTGWNRTAVP